MRTDRGVARDFSWWRTFIKTSLLHLTHARIAETGPALAGGKGCNCPLRPNDMIVSSNADAPKSDIPNAPIVDTPNETPLPFTLMSVLPPSQKMVTPAESIATLRHCKYYMHIISMR